jgi:hypothetical protein
MVVGMHGLKGAQKRGVIRKRKVAVRYCLVEKGVEVGAMWVGRGLRW